MKSLACLFVLITGISSVACTAGTNRNEASGERDARLVAVETLYSSTKCGHLVPEVKASLISNAEQLAGAYKGFRKDVLGAPPTVLPSIDFQREVVVLIEMGRRPTLGYRLLLVEVQPSIVNNRLEVVLDWIEPGRDMMVGEMLTSPCLLLKFARGPYQEVWFKDRSGHRKTAVIISP